MKGAEINAKTDRFDNWSFPGLLFIGLLEMDILRLLKF